MKQGLDGGQVFSVARTTIFIVPTEAASGKNTAGEVTKPPKAEKHHAGQPAAAVPPAAKNPKAAGKAKKGSPTKKAADGGAGAGDASGATTSPMLTNPLSATLIDGQSWSAVPVPVSDPQTTLLVTGTNNLFHTDNLGVGHPDNSDIVSKLTSNSTDNTQQLIQAAATIATTVAPLLVAAAAPPGGAAAAADKLRSVMLRVPDAPVTTEQPIEQLSGWTYTLDWSAPPAGAIPLEAFLNSVGTSKVAVFPVPVCIPAVLTLFKENALQATFSVTVGTPAWVRPTPLPAVGTVTMGSVCGSSSVDQSPSNSNTAIGVVEALAKAASDINTALQKANPGNPAVKNSSKALAIAAKPSH